MFTTISYTFILFTFCFIFSLSPLIYREFSNERGRVERRAQFVKERARAMFNADFNAYLSWITEAGLLNTDKVCSSDARGESTFEFVVNNLLQDFEEAQIFMNLGLVSFVYARKIKLFICWVL